MSSPNASAAWPEELTGPLSRARLLVLDVDGTLTDGRVVYVGTEELQSFSVRDGQGLVWLRSAGVEIAWISGRGSVATKRRASELGVEELHLGVGSKRSVLAGVQERLRITAEETVAMGDDLPDLEFRGLAAVFACPQDAHAEVRALAGLVTSARGGAGAVREVAEAILRAKGLWDEALAGYVHPAE